MTVNKANERVSIMRSFGRKKKDDNGIVILKQTRPDECGGTDAYQDTKAPKEILSREMTYFSARSALGRGSGGPCEGGEGHAGLEYICAYAAPGREGSFMFLETKDSPWEDEGVRRSWAYVKSDVFPALADLVSECGLAKDNGYHSVTHGLPEDFGGSVDVEYKSGETVSFSDNQCPVISPDTAGRIAAFFGSEMAGEAVRLPDLSSLVSVRFDETRKDGGFTRAELTVLPDGTGTVRKACRYSGPDTYETENAAGAEKVSAVKDTVSSTGLLAWTGLPGTASVTGNEKSLTFVFRDGRTVTVPDGRRVPDRIRRGFFDIELEISVKS